VSYEHRHASAAPQAHLGAMGDQGVGTPEVTLPARAVQGSTRGEWESRCTRGDRGSKSPAAPHDRRIGSYGTSGLRLRSIRLDAGELHHLGAFLRFLGEELAEIGRRARKHCGAKVCETRL
jgi:hypothetical protein